MLRFGLPIIEDDSGTVANPAIRGEKKDPKKGRKEAISLLYIVTATMIIALLFMRFVGGCATVSGESMAPTLEHGDVVLQEKISKMRERFDIVIVKSEDGLIIKRIIGLPGETVRISGNEIYINGSRLADVVSADMGYSGIAAEDVTLGNTEYFVLGDNRSDSVDSRDESIGKVDAKDIISCVIYRLLPPKSLKQEG